VLPFFPQLLIGDRMLVWWVLGGLACAALAALALVPLRAPEAPPARPTRSHAAALEALAELQAAEGPEIPAPCRTQLLAPQGPAKGTLLLIHGYTNCPAQFAEVAEILCSHGYFVFLPRLPRHGIADRFDRRHLQDLTAEEVLAAAQRWLDVAAGLPGPLWVAGFSAGGALTMWSGSRPEVARVAAISPFVVPYRTPAPLARLAVRVRRLLGGVWIWWDPRLGERHGEGFHSYPGFPLSSLAEMMRVSLALLDGRVAPAHSPERVVVIDNLGDFAIHHGAARRALRRTYGACDAEVRELRIARELGWWHDFVDQGSSRCASPEQIADLLLAAWGAADDETAGGIASWADLPV
jgi:carboxylesterase